MKHVEATPTTIKKVTIPVFFDLSKFDPQKRRNDEEQSSRLYFVLS
tara:strand:+ start:180 stop:317 length:138 start_codon:yes stop_codon:yes gene_type:complete